MIGTILYLFYNVLSLCMMWYTVNRCLDAKVSRRAILLTQAGSILFCLISYLFTRSTVVDSLRPFLVISSFIFPSLFLYKNKVFRKLLVVVCVYFTAVVADIVIYLLFPTGGVNIIDQKFSLMDNWWYLCYLAAQAMALFVVFILLPKQFSDNVERLPAKQYWFFLFFPISQFALISELLYRLEKNLSPSVFTIMAVISCICFLADVVWFREIRRITDNARLKAENDLLGKQIDAQREYYTLLTANYADMSAMRHDIANHIYTIRVLLQDGKSQEAMEYATELEQGPTARSILSSCKNSVVHSFLQHRLEELQKEEITADFDVTLGPGSGVSDTDLIIALGNMLDNAAEACSAASQPKISLKVAQRDGYVHIETENTCPPAPQPKKRRIAYLERGVGTSILQSLAEQYQGSYTVAREDGVNHALLVLQESSKC